MVQCQLTKQKYALKKVDFSDLNVDTITIKQLIDEVSLLEKIKDNRFIVKLFSSKVTNHFALLFLAEKFEIMDHISPICLPEPNTLPSASELCVSHGWDKDKSGR